MARIVRFHQTGGPVNVVAPEAVTNYVFTKTLGKVLHRPAVLPMPVFAVRLALGEMTDGLLLASACVLPQRLKETAFAFQHPNLEEALRSVLEPAISGPSPAREA